MYDISKKVHFERESRLGKDKNALLRAKVALDAVQPDLMSVVSQRISRGAISVDK